MSFAFRIPPAVGVSLVLAALPAISHADAADTARIRDLEKKLEQSMALIERLAAKVEQLEQQGTQRQTSLEGKPGQAEKLEALERQVADLGSGLSRHASDSTMPLRGFADVGLLRSTENNARTTGRKGATVGAMSLYFTPQFSDRVRALIELAFEVEPNGQVESDLERIQLGYAFSDAATAWLGRFHTPYGYWNTAYHHGAQIQTSIMRPRFLDFEDSGGILPAHTTGLWLTGKFQTANGTLGYDAYTGNAPQIINAGGGTGNLNMRMAGSTAYRTSTGFNTWFSPNSIEGLRVGIHGLYASGVLDDSPAANRTRLGMSGAYGVYQSDSWEMLTEYYRFRNQDITGGTGTHHSWAGYAQIGYNAGQLTPYGRIERSKLDQQDNYFAVQENGRSYRRIAVGLRFDVDPKAAIKVELNNTRKEDLPGGVIDTYSELRMQYAIRF